ncbi:LLM class flavin-dependent oxidoreductase [Pseudonocardia charpentierae]|uniref:LLM class flavin-dependent oxidoreductase n=1 Tax=Pseudonocardia charpentierae TaxID=3075545 RepID=A0ABU2NAD0_9PSEU|nr:LLM class flavin-dependent oxidoreductase [Pseudonocardia sp. DSM 45834]MDT0350003.1 LLM class flavin-dependent oxidoreductase [Pseudonocardia sp. DSM 45834]
MEIGVYTFADVSLDPDGVGPAQRLREVVEEIALADEVGLDVFGVGEHHRRDYASSAPAVILAAGAERSSRIRLTSAVSVLSSDDPVRVFQQFSTLDLLSDGRAEIMAGRGSFVESFPLFGYDLGDYDALFTEKLDLLLAVRAHERVTWSGRHRPALDDQPVYPRPVQDPLPAAAVRRSPSTGIRTIVKAGEPGGCGSGSPWAAARPPWSAPARSASRSRSRSSVGSRSGSRPWWRCTGRRRPGPDTGTCR